jgi:glycosyltransferase involved in cell wall biosynthesis
MWTLNGEKTLAVVLGQINKVIPREAVNQKLVIDDGSVDQTKAIASFMGWKVIQNDGKGISNAANTALKHVETKRFCSFEQDVLVSSDWFTYIPKLISVEPRRQASCNITVASGCRVTSGSKALYDIGLYEAKRFNNIDFPRNCHQFGMSLDNTVYDTEFMNSIGGFPNVKGGAGVDCLLAKNVFYSGFRWMVNYNVVSSHIRKGVWNELKHYYWYGKCQGQIDNSKGAYIGLGCRVAFSPLRGLDIAVKQHNLRCMFVYPAIRASSFIGAVEGLF